MKTEISEVNSENIDSDRIKRAAEIIKKGGLVAFPTETVYGLGADALNPYAVAKIFEMKDRPLHDPLIVHIADKQDLSNLSTEVREIALDLIEEFWPGPLTLVLRKSEIVPYIVTAGLDTVAVRMPDHPVALRLIKEAQTPLAAPSANLFGRPSPTSAEHVLDDLKGKVDFILDGGKTNIGIESTILDLTQEPFCVLRPGAISLEDLRKLVPQVRLYRGNKILSPGMAIRHYSPKAKVILVEKNGKVQADKIRDIASELAGQGYIFGIMVREENKDKYGGYNVKVLGPEENLSICAANLFSILRDFDKEGVDVIIVEGIKEQGLGLAIMDRLRRSSKNQGQ